LFAAGWCADGRAIAVTQVRVHFSVIPSNKIAAESCRHHGRYSRRRRTQLRAWTRGGLQHPIRRCQLRGHAHQIPHRWPPAARGASRSPALSLLGDYGWSLPCHLLC
jgi:hypothetical protein